SQCWGGEFEEGARESGSARAAIRAVASFVRLGLSVQQLRGRDRKDPPPAGARRRRPRAHLRRQCARVARVGSRRMIIDAHVHLMSDTTGWYAYTKSSGGSDAAARGGGATVRLLDESGIDCCWLFTLAGLYGFNDWRAANDAVIEAAQQHPGRLVPFCTAFPNQDAQAAADEIRRCLDGGCKGVKFHPWLQSFPANSSYLY